MSIIGIRRRRTATPTYVVIDRLHGRRAVAVSGDRIAETVASWLSELGVQTPLIDALAQAAQHGDWATAHALADRLSVEVWVT
jgi:hypothetical protein